MAFVLPAQQEKWTQESKSISKAKHDSRLMDCSATHTHTHTNTLVQTHWQATDCERVNCRSRSTCKGHGKCMYKYVCVLTCWRSGMPHRRQPHPTVSGQPSGTTRVHCPWLVLAPRVGVLFLCLCPLLQLYTHIDIYILYIHIYKCMFISMYVALYVCWFFNV